MTKSGAMGGNLRLCSGVSASQRSRRIQAVEEFTIWLRESSKECGVRKTIEVNKWQH